MPQFEPVQEEHYALQEKDGIDFAGFDIHFSNDNEIDEVKEDQGHWKSAKKQQKLRRDFEKLVLGKDTQTRSLDVYKRMKYPQQPQLTNIIPSAFSFDINSGLFDASTGLSNGSKFSLVDRIATKLDDEQVKREFVQDLMKQEL